MQFSASALIATLVASAVAVPTYNGGNNGGNNGGDKGGDKGGDVSVCSASSQTTVCCNGLLSCLVNLGSCSGSAYCCESNAAPGTLINISLLNCVAL